MRLANAADPSIGCSLITLNDYHTQSVKSEDQSLKDDGGA
jgi:hypothetical protein